MDGHEGTGPRVRKSGSVCQKPGTESELRLWGWMADIGTGCPKTLDKVKLRVLPSRETLRMITLLNGTFYPMLALEFDTPREEA